MTGKCEWSRLWCLGRERLAIFSSIVVSRINFNDVDLWTVSVDAEVQIPIVRISTSA